MLDKKDSRDGGVSTLVVADGVTGSPPPVMVLCDVICGVCIVLVIKVTVYLYTVVCDVTTGRLTIIHTVTRDRWL
eukprot:5763572-Pyramimonas_sp.AAC.1